MHNAKGIRVKTGAGSWASPTSSVWFRRGVLGLAAAAGIVILLGFARFPQISGSPLPYLAVAIGAAAVVVLPAGLILLTTRAANGPATLIGAGIGRLSAAVLHRSRATR
jgi:hypothetical protein